MPIAYYSMNRILMNGGVLFAKTREEMQREMDEYNRRHQESYQNPNAAGGSGTSGGNVKKDSRAKRKATGS